MRSIPASWFGGVPENIDHGYIQRKIKQMENGGDRDKCLYLIATHIDLGFTRLDDENRAIVEQWVQDYKEAYPG